MSATAAYYSMMYRLSVQKYDSRRVIWTWERIHEKTHIRYKQCPSFRAFYPTGDYIGFSKN